MWLFIPATEHFPDISDIRMVYKSKFHVPVYLTAKNKIPPGCVRQVVILPTSAVYTPD